MLNFTSHGAKKLIWIYAIGSLWVEFMTKALFSPFKNVTWKVYLQ